MNYKSLKILGIVLASTLTAGSLMACAKTNTTDTTNTTESATASDNESETTNGNESTNATETDASIAMPEPFDYSQGIDENGFWAGVKASDDVKLAEYDKITVPLANHEVTDEQVKTEIDGYLANAMTTKEVNDRTIKDGDTVNIDYVGSTGGVEFEGGSTKGQGTEVTIGVTQYIDDFLQQLIGHKPGEKFDIEVTFPEDYGNKELAGKDATFAITVNHIVEKVLPELTDAYVAENFGAAKGWKTVDEMKKGVHDHLQTRLITAFVQQYLVENSTFTKVPQETLNYQEAAMISYYEMQAATYGMELEQFLQMSDGVETLEALKEKHLENNTRAAKYSLLVQAIAEKENIKITDEDVAKHFKDNLGADSLDSYSQRYGDHYLKQVTLAQKVLDLVLGKAELANA